MSELNTPESDKRKRWMKAYEAELMKRQDYSPGMIDWDLAIHLYDTTSRGPQAAARACRQPFLNHQGVCA